MDLAELYGPGPAPRMLPGDGQWQFPLHDYLAGPRISAARCLIMSRVGQFATVGNLHFEPTESMLEQMTWREIQNARNPSAGKIGLRCSPDGALAQWRGAHECTAWPNNTRAGVRDWDAIIDVEGQPMWGKEVGLDAGVFDSTLR